MANDAQRAWQRSLKNGKTEAYASVDGASLRIVAEREVVEDVLDEFARVLDIDFDFDTPSTVIPGQTTIEEMLA